MQVLMSRTQELARRRESRERERTRLVGEQRALELMREFYPRERVTLARRVVVDGSRREPIAFLVMECCEGAGVAPLKLVTFNGVRVVTRTRR
jgi:hypothetical protein